MGTPAFFGQEQLEFLRKLGHELRTPLNSVVSTSEMLLNGVYGELSAGQRSAAERVLRGGDRMLDMIEASMLYVRARSDALKFEKVRLVLRELFESQIGSFREEAAARSLTFEVNYHADPDAEVLADAELLGTLIHKLVDNAVLYTAEGCILIGVQNKNYTEWRFTISDTGVGIAAADLPHIFKPFYRGQEAKRRHPAGCGLGLSIVSELARLMGGTVQVQSLPGEGTRVSVDLYLPAA